MASDPSADTAPPPEPARPSRLSRFARTVRNYLILFLVLAIAAVTLYLFLAMRWSYSSGERAGYEQHLGLPSCLGDTQYWVTSVRRVEP